MLPPAQQLRSEVYHQIFRGEYFYPLPTSSNYEVFQSLLEEEERNGNSLLMDARNCLEAAGISPVTVLRRGDAATEILEYVRKNQIDLTVVGSRGLNRIQGWLLGSVSRKLTHYGVSSVLIVKGG